MPWIQIKLAVRRLFRFSNDEHHRVPIFELRAITIRLEERKFSELKENKIHQKYAENNFSLVKSK